MGIFRKIKKLGNLLLDPQDDAPPSPFPRQKRRNGNEQANIDYGPLPQSFFSAVDSARQNAGYDPLPVFPRGPIPPPNEESHIYEDPDGEKHLFNRSRSKSRDQSSHRRHSRGTPVKFRRRPISPELFQRRDGSPFLFRQHSLPNTPDMRRHFQQHPQQFQHMPGQQQQFDMRMIGQPVQFFPQFQQPFYPMMNPNVHMYPWFMMQRPQMYPFY